MKKKTTAIKSVSPKITKEQREAETQRRINVAIDAAIRDFQHTPRALADRAVLDLVAKAGEASRRARQAEALGTHDLIAMAQEQAYGEALSALSLEREAERMAALGVER